MSTKLRELEDNMLECERALQQAKKAVCEEKLRLIEEEYGVRPGVLVTDSRRGFVYQVADIETRHWSPGSGRKPWAYGRKILKGGGLGKVVNSLYNDWELWKEDE